MPQRNRCLLLIQDEEKKDFTVEHCCYLEFVINDIKYIQERKKKKYIYIYIYIYFQVYKIYYLCMWLSGHSSMFLHIGILNCMCVYNYVV